MQQRTLPDAAAKATRSYLEEHAWPPGLVASFLAHLPLYPLRVVLCDDSTSMRSDDGRLVTSLHGGGGGSMKLVEGVTRWAELRDTLRFHAHLASAAGAETEFRLLNGAAPIRVGASAAEDGVNLPILTALLEQPPEGGTPLCHHLREVTARLTALAPTLRAEGRKAVVIIMTDGEPSDGDVADALRPLQNLPVYVLVRLCSAPESVSAMWRGLATRLELHMDVVEDPVAEASTASGAVDWLVYGAPVHRLREFGVPLPVVAPVTRGHGAPRLDAAQMRALLTFVLGNELTGVDPVAQWKHFLFAVDRLNDAAPTTWDPVAREAARWVRMRQLIAAYSPHAGAAAAAATMHDNNAGGGAVPGPDPNASPSRAPVVDYIPAPAPAAAPPTTAYIFDAQFAQPGPLGLSLLPHRLTYTAPGTNEARVIVVPIVTASKFTAEIRPGDAMLTINGARLLAEGPAATLADTTTALRPHFEAATRTIGAASAPKSVRFFRLERPATGGTQTTTPVSLDEARVLAAQAGILL